ncbi:3'-5' exonuclease [Metallosphaera hakonensis]|uniref:3'-5' exonuclease n=1 Tax=Metallosphaera hakonensis TaxID=79601 RepID=UPI000AAF0550|nr:3'-5' exonuclease [Metallosphaera hakonensis]
MRVSVFVLDFSYDVEDNVPEIYIWGIDENGNRVVIIEKTFRPYFYVLPKDGTNLKQISEQIRALSKQQSPITQISEKEMKYFGTPLKVLRVETVIPVFVRTYREEIAKINGVKEVLEADIRFYMRYSIDTNVRPFFLDNG